MEEPTIDEMRHETRFIWAHHVAFASNANCRQDIVACAHYVPKSGPVQLRDHAGGTGFQLVLENDEAHEFEVAFGLSPSQFLNLPPAEFPFVFGGTGNHTEAFVGVVVEKIFVI